VILLNSINKFPEKDDRKRLFYSKLEKWKTKNEKIEIKDEINEKMSFVNLTESENDKNLKELTSKNDFYHYKHKNKFEYVPKPVCSVEKQECNYNSVIKMDWTLDQQKQRMCDALRILSRFYKLEGIDA
jgi:alpha-acetolactate decarboxylase